MLFYYDIKYYENIDIVIKIIISIIINKYWIL
jgi:hypothetical protein